MKHRVLNTALGLAVTAAAAIPTLTVPAHAAATSATTLVVHADQPFRAVTHVASGGLYGLDTATVPSDSLVAPLAVAIAGKRRAHETLSGG